MLEFKVKFGQNWVQAPGVKDPLDYFETFPQTSIFKQSIKFLQNILCNTAINKESKPFKLQESQNFMRANAWAIQYP